MAVVPLAEALAAAESDEAVRSWNGRYQQAQGGEEPPEADGATGGERIPAAREEVPERGGTDAPTPNLLNRVFQNQLSGVKKRGKKETITL